MIISARNKFKGTIKEMFVDQVMAEIIVSVGDLEMVSLISRDSARKMQLKVGDEVTAVIKSTEVIIGKD